jgi:hypothetical protein
MAQPGLGEMSDLSPKSDPKRTLLSPSQLITIYEYTDLVKLQSPSPNVIQSACCNVPSRPASSRLPKPISFPPANCGFTKNKNMDNDQIIELARLHLSVDPPTPGGPVPVLPPQLEKALELLTDPSDRAAMDVAVHVLGGKPYTRELDNRETLHRCQWLAIDLGAKVRIWEDKKNPRHWFLEITPSDEE